MGGLALVSLQGHGGYSSVGIGSLNQNGGLQLWGVKSLECFEESIHWVCLSLGCVLFLGDLWRKDGGC